MDKDNKILKNIPENIKKEIKTAISFLPSFAQNIRIRPSIGNVYFQIPLEFRMSKQYEKFLNELNSNLKKIDYYELGGGCAMKQEGSSLYDEVIGPKDLKAWAKKHSIELPDGLKN